jgi:hypothetical protein
MGVVNIARWGAVSVSRTATAVLQLRGAAKPTRGCSCSSVQLAAAFLDVFDSRGIGSFNPGAPGVRRLELGENEHVPHVDTCGALKPCPQAHLRAGASGRSRNRSARPCEYLKEDALRWGAGSFFTRAPLRARAFALVCASLTHMCVCARLRTVLAMCFEYGSD